MLTRNKMEQIWQGKLICATHFNYIAWSDYHSTYCWLSKPWDEHHKKGGDPDNDTTYEDNKVRVDVSSVT